MQNVATFDNRIAGPAAAAATTADSTARVALLARLYRLYTAVPTMASGFAIWNAIAVAALVFGGPTALYVTLIPYVLGTLVLAPKQPFIAVMLFFAYYSIEGMYKYASGFSTAIYVIAPLMVAIDLGGWIIAMRQAGRTKAPPGAVSLYVFVIIAVMACFNPQSSAIGGNAVINGLATAYLWYVGPLLIYFLTFNTVRNSRPVLLFFYMAICISTIVSLVAILQLVMGQTWTWQHFPGTQFTLDATGTTYRPPSTTPTGAGGCQWARYGLILPMALMSTGYVRPSRRVWLVAALIINCICLIISGVRLLAFQSACDVLVFVLLTATSQKQALRSVLVCVIGGAIAIYVAGLLTGGKIAGRYADTLANPLERYQQERGYNLKGFSEYIIDHPLGEGYQRGLGSWQDVSSQFRAREAEQPDTGGDYGALRDTAFGAVAQDVGLPGLIAAFTGIAVVLWNGYRAFRKLRTRHLRAVAAALFALMAGLVPGCFAGPVLQGAYYFWIAAGLVMLLPSIEEREFLLADDSGTAAPKEPAARRISPSALRRLEREAAAPGRLGGSGGGNSAGEARA